MKMVKSLLLGSAAGLVAVTAGQAADLPVKAKPVEYVRICSLYGAGFFYMPGTELCMKIGGFVRYEAAEGSNGNLSWGPFSGNANNRNTTNLAFRARGYITADVREQSAYGTIRGYIAVGLSTNSAGLDTSANQFSANRAFLQFAGFTWGITQSFYDYYSAAAVLLRAGYSPSSDTGDPGWVVAGYTAQLGNGFTATISEEARRLTETIDGNALNSSPLGATIVAPTAATGTMTPGGYTTTIGGVSANAGAYGGQQMGDIVGNLRLDQAWGGGQIMGALHKVNATYYSTGLGTTPTIFGGHPSDAWGWAGGVGLRINAPFIAQGDYFQSQFNYTQGATRYAMFGQSGNWGNVRGGTESFGVNTDCVYGGTIAGGTNTSCHLTTAIGLNLSYEHYWTPQWHQSLVGGVDWIRYDTTANAILCGAAGGGNGTMGASGGTSATATAGCNNNWSDWFIGSRLQWDVTKNFYLAVDAVYLRQQSATICATCTLGAYAIGGSGALTAANQGNLSVAFRAHRDFLP
jgi:hypothetical protein